MKKVRFWPALGIVLGADVVLVLLYTVIVPGVTGRAYSDSLCVSATLLGLAAAVPVLLDMGRGVGLASKIGVSDESRHEALEKERERRYRGSTITFVFAAAAFVITLLSIIISFL
jgi:hypothetical protein